MTTTAATPAAATSEGAPATKPAESKPAETPAGKSAETPAGKPAEAPAAKPADSKPAEAAKPEKPADAAPVVPEKYDLKLPDGGFLDEEDLATLGTLAREKKLDNASAQALANQVAEQRAGQSAAFRAVTEADKEYGGEKLDETQQLAKLALDTLRPVGTPRGDAFRRLLGRSGYGNHIEVLSLLADLGRGMREDHPVGGGRPRGAAAKTLEDTLYDGK